MRIVGPFLLIVLLLPHQSLARDAEPPDTMRRNVIGGTIAASHWPAADRLELAPVDYTAQQSGRFESTGVGMAVFYRRRLLSPQSPAVMLGCDFAGNSHDNERAAVWTNAVTGEQSAVRYSVVWGYLTGAARFVWRESRLPEIALGGGVGLYLIKLQERIEAFGYADSGDDANWGGYLSAGLQFPISESPLDLTTELKWHMFSFDDLGRYLPDQDVGGPAYTLELGLSWSF